MAESIDVPVGCRSRFTISDDTAHGIRGDDDRGYHRTAHGLADGDSPLISKHHSNWRLRAVQSLEKEDREEDLHYSSVVSISKEDFMRVRFALTRELEATKAIIRDTEPTELCGLCMDFFKL